jgi:hypothetical protein
MGGNAIIVDGKSITSRLSKSYVDKIAAYIVPILQEHIGPCMLPRQLQKPTHGDLDVLYFTKTNVDILYQTIRKIFSPTKIVDGYANRVISFDIDCQQFGLENTRFQIDLIRCDKTCPINTDIYFSYGRLSMILGIIFNFYNITYTDTGIYYEYKKKKITICENLKTVLNFFNLDYSMWEKFENAENKDVFEWVARSHLMSRRVIRRMSADLKRIENDPTHSFYYQFIKFLLERFSKEIDSGIEFNESNVLEITSKHFNVYDKVIELMKEKENDEKIIDSRKIIQIFKKSLKREPNREEMAECCKKFIGKTDQDALIAFVIAKFTTTTTTNGNDDQNQ